MLTSRDKKREKRGPPWQVPHHALKLTSAAWSKRLLWPFATRWKTTTVGLVKREVVRVVTPGTIIEDNLLDPARNNWLLALVRRSEEWGVAYVDVSTAQFQCTEFAGSKEQVESFILSLNPSEIIVADKTHAQGIKSIITEVQEDSQSLHDLYRQLPRTIFALRRWRPGRWLWSALI